MSWLKFWLRNTAKATHQGSWTVAFILIPISVLGIYIKSSAGNPVTPPAIATFDEWKGYITTRRGDGQAKPVKSDSLLEKDVDVLEVPGSTRGVEHWAHLRFKGGKPSNYLVQAGTDSSPTKYRFPCYYGGGSMVWGLRQQGQNKVCERIIVGSAGWRSSISGTSVAHKSKLREGKDSFIAQRDPGQVTVAPSNGLTLVYIHEEFGNTVVDVLAGAVTVRAATGSTIVRGGVRYTDAGDGRRGSTSPLPEEVYRSRPVQIFLDPNNWSEDMRSQINDFQEAVAVQNTRLTEPDPLPTSIPTPTQPQDPPPRRDRDTPDQTQPSAPPPTRTTSPVTQPPVPR
jgi:hypothetical protein